MPDGEYFTTFNKYHCKSSYQTEHGIANATAKCKEDEKCAMISTLDCANGNSVYSLCEKSSELIPELEACTLWKIGNEIMFKISSRAYICKIVEERQNIRNTNLVHIVYNNRIIV